MQTLQGLIREVAKRRRSLAPVDYRVDLGQVELDVRDGGLFMHGVRNRNPLRLNDRAKGQLLGRLGIPASHFDRCPSRIQRAELKWFLQNGDHDRRALVRTVRRSEVRAVLGSRYSPADDSTIFPIVADVLADSDCAVQSADFSGDFTHIRVLFRKASEQVRKGDIVRAGIHISNSEIGLRSVRVDCLVFRLICTNGMVRQEPEVRCAFRHVGDPERLRDSLRMAIVAAREGAIALMAKFKESAGQRIEDPEEYFLRAGDRFALSERQRQAIESAFHEAGDASLFGAINAVTFAAQSEPSAEDRYQLERVGAALLDRA